MQITPSKEDVEEELSGFNFAVEQDEDKRDTLAVVEPPAHFSQGSSCKIFIKDRGVEPCSYAPGEMKADHTILRVHYLRSDVPASYPKILE